MVLCTLSVIISCTRSLFLLLFFCPIFRLFIQILIFAVAPGACVSDLSASEIDGVNQIKLYYMF